MQTQEFYWGLQIFADGGGEGAAASGDGSAAPASGVTPQDAAGDREARLLALGVPADKLNRHRAKAPARATGAATAANPQQETQQDAAAKAANQGQQSAKETQVKRLSWDEILKDPEYNREMQRTVQARLKNSKQAEDTLTAISPAMQLLAKKYGIEADKTGNFDMNAIAQAITDDDSFYEDQADELGVSNEVAKGIAQAEQKARLYDQMQQQTEEQRRIQAHYEGLVAQAETLKQKIPTFDLQKELDNPTFARMTAPGSVLSMEDVYFAVHRDEIMAAQRAATEDAARKAAQQVSSSVARRAARPNENGAVSQAASISGIDFHNPSYREMVKNKMREAQIRGGKYYPDGTIR